MAANPADKSHVQTMFGRIAKRYDRMNRLMTLGQDQRWRRIVTHKAHLTNQSIVLDIAAGTGDIAFEIRRQYPKATVVAADFALPMMQVGRDRPTGSQVEWLGANALQLPFPNNHFDAVVSGFLLRNVPDIDQTLAEHYRVLKPGGWAVSLDTTPPRDNLLRPFINLYLTSIVPLIGRLVVGDRDAYQYLSGSTLGFKKPEALVTRFETVGFQDVGFRRLMLGTIAVHWARKP
ncbi:MAG: ubiquinone/menaquinone biosynthesis methyltransferase [Chloroflexi bacterium]|nr:ubiquinone/menaquinone biosynthesis methyltransferase [Chloroflexota bacterium]